MTRADRTTAAQPGHYVPCPTCKARADRACKTSSGARVKATWGVHPARLALEAAALKNQQRDGVREVAG